MHVLYVKTELAVGLFFEELLKFAFAQYALASLFGADCHLGMSKVHIQHDALFPPHRTAVNQLIVVTLGFVDIALGV